MNKLYKIFKLIEPILGKKIPTFNQTIKEFGTSKSNTFAAVMIVAGLSMLYINTDNALGLLLVTNGIGLITLKDATTKRNKDASG